MDAFICDAVRTPIGRFGGNLASMRSDDMAANVIRGLMARHPSLDPSRIDEVVFGCANQAGEDNRNVARMASLLLACQQRCQLARLTGFVHLVWTPWLWRRAA